jgi:malonyl-CoA decarboxylase
VGLGKLFELPARDERGVPRAATRAAKKAISLCHALRSGRGEVSGVRIAAEVLELYKTFDAPTRQEFFAALERDFAPSQADLNKAIDRYRAVPTADALKALQEVAEPPRVELLRRLNTAPGATVQLVAMRGDLLDELKAHPEWTPVADDLAHLFTSWFNRGFLQLKRIDWRSPALVLEKLITYEAVHEIHGWEDLRRRLDKDRRCYAFFHPAMPHEPVVFIEVALTRGISPKVQPLLDPSSAITDPQQADTAIFYSITNCQNGLSGVPFGSFLIKQVVDDLRAEFPRLRKFSTLSPIPGFRGWMKASRKRLEGDPRYADLMAALEDMPGFEPSQLTPVMERQLTGLCAYYLVLAKSSGRPVDPVARFHLRNGARLERINWLGDVSSTGWKRSAGLMANYVYRLDELEANHEAYRADGKVAASSDIVSLAKKGAPAVSKAPAEGG